MAENIIEDLRKNLNLDKLTIKYQPITSQNRIPLVLNGTVDFECGSTTNNKARQKEIDYANTTFMEQERIVVKANSTINSLDDLKNKTVVATTGTTANPLLRRKSKEKNLNIKIINTKDHSDSFLLLETDRVDAYVNDHTILLANIMRAKNPKDFKIVGEPLSNLPTACMLRKNDEKFRQAINDSIARQVADGTLNNLWDKWFLKPIPPNNAIVGLELSEATLNAWKNPNNKPAEDFE